MLTPGDDWRALERELRPFVAARVRVASDVDDVLQEVFLRLHRGLGGLRDDERFGPWVYRVARNALVDHARSARRHAPAVETGEAAELELEAPVAADDDDARAAESFARFVGPFIARLPEPYREALTLTELEGLTQREAAELLGVSLSGMKSRVQRGRTKLREALEACCEVALDARGRVVGYAPRALPLGCCGPQSCGPDGGGCSA